MENKITSITLNKNINSNSKSYEATISINNEYVIQVSGNENEALFSGVSHSSDAFHEDAERQNHAYKNIDNDELEKELEDWGFVNNLFWLEEHATTVL